MPCRPLAPALAFLALLAVASSNEDASAQEPGIAEVARARALFAEGEAAAAAERWADAIDRFERVRAIKETPGVVFHLAAAREGAGQIAAALTLFERSRDLARVARVEDVLTLADERIAALGHRVPRLIVRTAAGTANVLLDGRPLAAAELGTPIRVDPGRHRIEGIAGGAKVIRELDLAEGALLTVLLGPEASRGPAPTVAPPAPAPAVAAGEERGAAPKETGGRLPVGPIVLGATGLVLTGVGIGFFVAAGGENAAAKEACALQSAGRCDPTAQDTVRTLDRVALSMWIGAAGALGGATLWWVLDGASETTAALGPRGASLRGRF